MNKGDGSHQEFQRNYYHLNKTACGSSIEDDLIKVLDESKWSGNTCTQADSPIEYNLMEVFDEKPVFRRITYAQSGSPIEYNLMKVFDEEPVFKNIYYQINSPFEDNLVEVFDEEQVFRITYAQSGSLIEDNLMEMLAHNLVRQLNII